MCGGSKSITTQRVLLPDNVVPSAYKLDLDVNLDALTYTGVVTTTLTVKSQSNSITFHSLDLVIDISKCALKRADGSVVHPSSSSTSAEDETVTLIFQGSQFIVGEILELSVPFNHVIGTNMYGFYRAKYTVDGQTRYSACTQFEPADARRAFPCWDEPALKATFEISIAAPSNRVTLSNMPVASTVPIGNDRQKLLFQVTPIMSTYLVAFVIGEFDYVESKTKKGIPVRVYTPLGLSDKGKFALDCSCRTLDFFTDYFGIPYPLPKLDMIAIADFAAGAMENWGLITYREAALLCEPNSPLAPRVAYVIAHEEAHQWFGNIVSPQWWKELWLNEGFATWAGVLAVEHLFPEWDNWTQFTSTYLSSGLKLDSMLSSHPIEVDVAKSRDISEIFDIISYHKGAAVIRMLANYLGQEVFAKGLNVFLTRHLYGNAVTSDLWKALTEVSGIDVAALMGNWTSQMGYPVLSISSEGDKLSVKQTRFLSSGPAAPEHDQVTWNIPLAVQSSANKDITYLPVNGKTATLNYDTSKSSWFKANAGQSGFYRVQYSSDLLEKLKVALVQQQISAPDRLGIAADATALSQAGLMPLSQVLSILQSFVEEEDYTVWSEISSALGSIDRILGDQPYYPQFQTFRRNLFTKIFQKLGFDPKPTDTKITHMLRSLVLRSSGSVPEVRDEARVRFEAYLKDNASLSTDIRDAVFSIVGANGDKATQDQLKQIYKNAVMPDVKVATLGAIGIIQGEKEIKDTLTWMLNSGDVRAQDLPMVLASIIATSLGRKLAWTFVKENWNGFLEQLGTGQFLLSRVVEYTAGGFSTEEDAADIEKFFASHSTEGIERTVKNAIEKVRSNAAWLTREKDATSAFFA